MSLASPAGRVRSRAAPTLDGARSAAASAGERMLALAETNRITAGIAERLATVRPARPWLGALGWAVLATGVVAWWAGRRYGWVELTVLAVVAGVLLALSLAFAFGRSAYEVALDLAHRRVVVGARAVGRIEVRNASRRALLPAEIELPVGAALAGFPVPRLAAGEPYEELFAVPTTRRAVIVVGPVRSVRGDPFGIARREVRWTDPIEVFVHPKTVALTGASAGFLKDIEGRPTRVLSPSDMAFHALREYVPGDDRRHIHWKSTARTGHVMVRQFEETRRSHLAIGLSTNRADYDDPEEFELAVSVAGSLGLHAIREERDLTVLVPGRALAGGTAVRLLDDLTRVTLGTYRQDIASLTRALGVDAPDASLAVLLFGAPVTATQLRGAALRLPIEVRGLGIRCVPGAPLGRRAIGGLSVLTLGDLADLPVAMRRVAD